MADTTFISKVTAIAASWLQDINDTVYKVFAAAKTATDARAALQVPSNARAINTTAPLTGGGDLSADRTLGISDATDAAKGVIQLAGDLSGTAGAPTVPGLTSKVPTTRAVNTTAPLTGGGALSADLTLGVSAASDTAQGVVELATNAETITGTDAVRAVTPAGLAAKVASETAQGIVELATAAETTTGTDTTRAVHPAGLKVELGKKIYLLDKATTTVDVVNTAAETDLYRFTVPGNTLGTDKALRLSILGDYLNNSGASRLLTLAIKFGATTLATGSIVTVAASANRGVWSLYVVLYAKGATNVQNSVGRVSMITSGQAGMDGGWFSLTDLHGFHRAIAEDSTGSKDIAVTTTHPVADANLSMRMLDARLELLP